MIRGRVKDLARVLRALADLLDPEPTIIVVDLADYREQVECAMVEAIVEMASRN